MKTETDPDTLDPANDITGTENQAFSIFDANSTTAAVNSDFSGEPTLDDFSFNVSDASLNWVFTPANSYKSNCEYT